MGTAIVVIVILVGMIFAVKNSLKHLKGEGGCCGGSGSSEPKVKKQHLSQVVAVKHLEIEGMHCDNCRKRVENCLNSLDQVNAKVNLDKKEAVVKLGKEIPDEALRETVEKAGYQVLSVRAD